jgi:CheY-like chemotaxis protein
MISVSDTGSGMTKEVIEKAFQPFFTTKEVGRGTGLGLSMVYGFVKQSGGHAKLYSEPGIGTTIKIYLPPLARGEHDDAFQQNVGSTSHKGSGRMLVVEDDPLVRESVCAKLEKLGYDVAQVNSASEAITALEHDSGYSLVFTDVIMPGEMTGADLVRKVKQRWPGIRLLMTSGYTEVSALGKIKMPEGVRLLSKPYSNAELAAAIEETTRSGQAEG